MSVIQHCNLLKDKMFQDARYVFIVTKVNREHISTVNVSFLST